MDMYSFIVLGRFISLPFLALTFLHYWYNTKFRVLYKKCLMNYIVILMITNVWVIFVLTLNYQKDHPKFIENIYGFISMSNLLWTNVLCYDFWRRIKNLMPYINSTGETRMYIKCSIYVWLNSFIHSIISYVNQYFLFSYSIHKPIKFILFIILGIVLFCNVLMMLHATIIIIKEMQSIKNLRGSDTYTSKKNHQQKLRLHLKLVAGTMLLLSSNWFWFLLSDLLGYDYSSNSKLYSFFEYMVLVNSFQGVLIFVIFTFKKKKVLAFKKKVSGLFSEQTVLSEVNTCETVRSGEKFSYSNKEEN